MARWFLLVLLSLPLAVACDTAGDGGGTTEEVAAPVCDDFSGSFVFTTGTCPWTGMTWDFLQTDCQTSVTVSAAVGSSFTLSGTVSEAGIDVSGTASGKEVACTGELDGEGVSLTCTVDGAVCLGTLGPACQDLSGDWQSTEGDCFTKGDWIAIEATDCALTVTGPDDGVTQGSTTGDDVSFEHPSSGETCSLTVNGNTMAGSCGQCVVTLKR